jgi:hypothetical protein
MIHFIEQIIEPTKLLVAWQSRDENRRTRYIVAELELINDDNIRFTYLFGTPDFQKAQDLGFEGYPAFPLTNKFYDKVLDTFMRRLPPRTRGDLPEYLAGHRIKANAQFSDFALLGYSGGKLPSDGFSFIHPFNNVDSSCELLVEAAGYRHVKDNHTQEIKVGNPVIFSEEFNQAIQEKAVCMHVADQHIGYVNRGLVPTFQDWIRAGRIVNAWVEKVNGTSDRPRIYVFVEISVPK